MGYFCKNCGIKCLSYYCSKACHKEFIDKTKWEHRTCLTCFENFKCRISSKKKYCSPKCSSSNKELISAKLIKSRRTCIERYGVTSPMHLDKFKDKLRKVFNDKYGVDWYSKSKEFLVKFKKTCNDLYGVDYPQQSTKIKEKSKKSFQEKYGGFTLESEILKSKFKTTMLNEYGVSHPLLSKDIKNKRDLTNIGKFGFKSPLSNNIVRNKINDTLKNKYNVTNISQVKDVQDVIKETRVEMFLSKVFSGNRIRSDTVPLFLRSEYKGIHYSNLYKFKCKACNGIFDDDFYAGNIPQCPVCFPKVTSIQQQEVYEFVKEVTNNKIEVLKNTRKVLPSGKEIDIFIPSLKLGIEYDGLYWHSEISGKKDNLYHLTKTRESEENGIQLVHIFENEWEEKRDIVKNYITTILNFNSYIIPENFCIKYVNKDEADNFFEKNHLVGKFNSDINLGVFSNNTLISVIGFSKIKEKTFNLDGFCINSEYNTEIIFKLLMNYFIQNEGPEFIQLTEDKRWPIYYKLLESLNFNLESVTSPKYWITTPHHTVLVEESSLKSAILNYNNDITEWENAQLNGYDRIWDCGYNKYVWNRAEL